MSIADDTAADALLHQRHLGTASGEPSTQVGVLRPEQQGIEPVELLEVDRTKLQEYGLQVASPGSAGINGSASIAGDGANRDLDGYFWIMGRIDDVLNVSGHRMGTMEIESALVRRQTS